MFTAVSYANMPFWNILPMGMTNYGGDIQIFNIDEYANRRINMTLNIPAQIQFCQAAAMNCGGFGGPPQINMDTVKALSEAMYNAGMSSVLQSKSANTSMSLSSTKSQLLALQSNDSLSDEDKATITKQLTEVEKLEKELNKIYESNGMTPQEKYQKANEINDKIKEIQTSTNEIAKKVSNTQEISTTQNISSDIMGSRTSENTDIESGQINTQGMILPGKRGSDYGPAFLDKVKKVAKNLNCDYRDLLAIMCSESGIDAHCVARNGATGLIMFMPQYFDTAKLRRMTPIQQLDEVERVLLQAKHNAGLGDKRLSAGQLYSLVFLPARANREVLTTAGENFYNSNKALDYNHDGKITQNELAQRISKKYVSDKTFIA